MLVSRTKPEGQAILQKLRDEEHVWVTLFDTNERVKVELTEETFEYNRVLCLIGQRLHVMTVGDDWSSNNTHVHDMFRHVFVRPKYIFGVVTESHVRK